MVSRIEEADRLLVEEVAGLAGLAIVGVVVTGVVVEVTVEVFDEVVEVVVVEPVDAGLVTVAAPDPVPTFTFVLLLVAVCFNL